MPPIPKIRAPEMPPGEHGFHNTPLDVKRQSPLLFQRIVWFFWIVLDVLELISGGRSRIRTYDFHRVKVALYR